MVALSKAGRNDAESQTLKVLRELRMNSEECKMQASETLRERTRIVRHDIVDKFATPEVSKRIYEHTMHALELHRSAGGPGGAGSPGYKHLMELAPQAQSWVDMMQTHPLFRLLDPFYRPNEERLRECEPTEKSVQEWFTDQWLGVGLRGRAHMEIECLHGLIKTAADTGESAPQVLALASGSGRHPLAALRRAQKDEGIRARGVFIDIDPRALATTKALAVDSEVSSCEVIARDILHAKGFQRERISSVLARTLKDKRVPPVSLRQFRPGSIDIISIIGLLEYLPLDNWDFHTGFSIGGKEITLKKHGIMDLLSEVWALLKPGGALMFNVINTESPASVQGNRNYQVDFCVDVIGWKAMNTYQPYGTVIPGESKVAHLAYVIEAGLDPASVEVHREPSGLFDIYVLHKAG